MRGTIWLLTIAVICICGCSIYAAVGDPVGHCEDGDIKCPDWAKIGDCNRIPQNMNILCRKSCNRCHLPFMCEDNHKSCKVWAKAGECTVNPNYMRWFCRRSCDTCTMAEKRATVDSDPSQQFVFQAQRGKVVMSQDSMENTDRASLTSNASQMSWLWVWGLVFLGCVGGFILSRLLSKRKIMM